MAVLGFHALAIWQLNWKLGPSNAFHYNIYQPLFGSHVQLQYTSSIIEPSPIGHQ